MQVPRTEIPNPSHHRPAWRTLNGTWDFAVDNEMLIRSPSDLPRGESTGKVPQFTETVQVPFCPQSDLSGVGLTDDQAVIWYRREFPLSEREAEGRVFIVFGAVDYACTLWVNGRWAAVHRGGYAPFRTEITSLVSGDSNEILLRVVDSRNPEQPRGKQSWQEPFNCWYRGCSGIWQPVWLEFTPRDGISSVRTTAVVTKIHSDILSNAEHRGTERTVRDRGSAHLQVVVTPLDPCEGEITVTVTHENNPVCTVRRETGYPATVFHLDFEDLPLWSPETPDLFDLEITMSTPAGRDTIQTYIGFRRVSIANGMLHLNGKPVYQRLVLDQGYWPDGLYTAPDDTAIRRDIETAQDMGFNGCRKHAKIEDPRFYYWADRLGYLVWEELPPAYLFTPASQRELIEHTLDMIKRDGTHPAVICWTLFNESWGVPDVHHEPEQRSFVDKLIETVRFLDPERLVIGNDGWEHTGGDVYGLHSYAPTAKELERDLNSAFSTTPPGRLNNGRPFHSTPSLPGGRLKLVTEFGGTGYLAIGDGRVDAWGYDNLAESPRDLLERIGSLVQTLRSRSDLSGFVYTQLTDVEQEVNGLLFADRSPKIDTAAIRKIITGKT